MYTPDADDATNPLLSTLAGTAQAEFQAIKQKMNNLFLASGYDPVLKQQQIQAGTILMMNIPADTATGIAYGHAVDITRNGSSGTSGIASVAAVAAQLNARLGNNINVPFDKTLYVFGYAAEAWSGETASQANLIGGEMAIISQCNENVSSLIGSNIVFKNMSDVRKLAENTPFQGLGADKYNSNSIAQYFSSFARSLSGERCGWGRGLVFEDSCFDEYFDTAAGVYKRPVGIDFRNQDGPFTAEPWTAYITPLKSGLASAIAIPEMMAISWDRLLFTKTWLDATATTFWMFGNGNTPTTVPRMGYDYGANNCLSLPNTVVTGAPGAATGTVQMRINGVNRNIHFS